MYPPSSHNVACAKLRMFITPKISDSPADRRKSIIARLSPLSSWIKKLPRSIGMATPYRLSVDFRGGGRPRKSPVSVQRHARGFWILRISSQVAGSQTSRPGTTMSDFGSKIGNGYCGVSTS